MRRRSLLLSAWLMLSVSSPLSAAYITDKLLAGFYKEPDTAGAPMQVLASGTPLELLETQGDFTRVRLTNRSEGWVETQFVTEEKPAQVMLLELQAVNGELRRRLSQAEAVPKPAGAKGSDSQELEEKFIQAQAEIKKLQNELKTAKEGHNITALPLWLLPTAGLLFLLGFIGGIIFRNYRLRKRLGGLRL